jgi:hypothetical protein
MSPNGAVRGDGVNDVCGGNYVTLSRRRHAASANDPGGCRVRGWTLRAGSRNGWCCRFNRNGNDARRNPVDGVRELQNVLGENVA